MKLALKAQSISLGLFCFSLPFSIAGDDFSASLLYLCGLALLFTQTQHWPKTPLNWLIPGFVVVSVGATFFAPQPWAGVLSLREFWRFALPFMVFFALNPASLIRGLRLLAFSTLLICLYALVQHFIGLDLLRSAQLRSEYQPEHAVWRAVGAFSHHLTFGGVNLLVWPILGMLSLVKSFSLKERLLYGASGVLSFLSAYASLGRSIWLGLFASLLFLGALKLKRRSVLLLLPIALVVLAVIGLQKSPRMQAEVAKLAVGPRILQGISKAENMDRIYMWQAARNAISDHPLLGLGINQDQVLQRYYDQITQATGSKFQHPASVGVHNLYLQAYLDFGLLGSLALFGWWVYLFKITLSQATAQKEFNHLQALRIGLLAGLVGSWTAAFFENNFWDGEVQSMILFVHGLALYLNSLAKSHPDPELQAQ